MNLNEKLGLVIRLHRSKEKLTQVELAQKAGITFRYLSDIEQGKRAVSIDVCTEIARVFRMKLFQLIKEAEELQL